MNDPLEILFLSKEEQLLVDQAKKTAKTEAFGEMLPTIFHHEKKIDSLENIVKYRVNYLLSCIKAIKALLIRDIEEFGEYKYKDNCVASSRVIEAMWVLQEIDEILKLKKSKLKPKQEGSD